MKGKLNESDCVAWENGDDPESYNIAHNAVNGSSELDQYHNEVISEPVLKSPRTHKSTLRLAWDPADHQSGEFKSFFDNCTKPILSEPLIAQIHFCCEEVEKSERKRCRSLQWQSSCATGSPVASPFECVDEFWRLDEKATPSDVLRNDVFEDESSDGSLNNDHNLPIQTSSKLMNMGCDQSSFLPYPEEDDRHLESNEQSGIGMNQKTDAALLKEQRHLSTDVTANFSNRWMESHFGEILTSKEGVTKRRDLKNRNRNTDLQLFPQTIDQSHQSDILIEQETLSLNILHFNDVYEITERSKDPVGGAARFAQLFKKKVAEFEQSSGERPLMVFSGDCLNPSTLSCATQGRHMIEVLNHLNIDVAVFGNHEFDFGVEHAVNCVKEMNSKWLLANVEDRLTERNLADGCPSHLITKKNGLKIGLIGLVEEEWLDTLATVEKSDLNYKDYVVEARRIAKELKEEGARYIIALTHMRWPNDIRLAEEVPEVDLILGGHDHGYGVKDVNDCLIVKSGSDFRTFSSIGISIRRTGCIDVTLTRHDVTMSSSTPDPEMKEIVDRYDEALNESLQKCIGSIKADLNGIFDSIRREETTLGNFVTDIMATVTKADLVLINSGTFRSDMVHRTGDFRLHDLMTILPINDTLVSIVVTGKQLLDAFENGVSKYPNLDGRFPQVSGASFGFIPDNEPGKRVVQSTIRIGGKPLDLDAEYNLVTKAYVARGKDGYACLSKCKILTDPDSGPLLSTVVRNHIWNVQRLMDFETSKSCKISVSSDGRQLTCNLPDVDVIRAFDEHNVEMEEAPIDAIQRQMRPVMSGDQSLPNHTSPSNLSTPNSNLQKTVHLPNFIAIADDITNSDSQTHDDLVLGARRSSLSADETNERLLRERARNPCDLKWQITPLIEARIFHCEV